jgi:hypothetical protein
MAGILIAMNAVLQVITALTGHETIFGLRRLFDVSDERTLPAFFSATILLIAGGLLLIMASCHWRAAERYPLMWFFLGLIFVYLSLDETIGFHETLTPHMRKVVPATGLLRFTWVAAAIPFVGLLGLAYWSALQALPRRTRGQVILAGMLFVGGAIGVEMIGGWYLEANGRNFGYHTLSALEEAMEMFGVILFIRALVEYMAQRFPGMRVHFDNVGNPAA